MNPNIQNLSHHMVDTITPLMMQRAYESGTFTPALASVGGSTTHTATGNHTRWAGFVRFHVRVVLSAISSPTGALTITGLPYTATQRAGPFAVRADNVTLDTGYSWLTARVAISSSTLILEQHGTGVATIALPGTALSASSVIEVSGAYDADEPTGTIVEPGEGGSGAPIDAAYVVMALNDSLTDERVLAVGTDMTLADGGAGGSATVGLSSNVPRIASANVFTAMQTATIADAGTNTTPTAATLTHNSSATPGVGFGVALDWHLKTTTTAGQPAAQDRADWVTATHGSQEGRRAIAAYQRGAMRERLSVGFSVSAVYAPWVSGDTYPTFAAGAATSDQTAVVGESSSGIGLLGLSASSTGVRGQSNSNVGVEAISGTLVPFHAIQTGTTGTTDVQTIVRLERRTVVTPAAGWGGQITALLESTTTEGREAGTLAWRWSDPTDATRTAYLSVALVENAGGTLTEALRVDTQDSATQTGVLLMHDGTLKRVKVGATDSGGTGFRALIIDN